MRKKPRKRRKATSNLRLRHLLACSRHLTYWLPTTVGVLALSFVGGLVPLAVQAQMGSTQKAEAAPAKKSKTEVFERQFLMFGTVFTEQGFSLPGAEIRVRRAGERKVRWEARSDRRGEFAVRVPKGAEYELTVKAQGFQEQMRKVDARAGSREDIVFRLQPVVGGKKK